MKIAIHKSDGRFSDRWITYCEENNIDYKIVNCYGSNIIDELEDCSGLMWHWSHEDYKAVLFARQLTLSLEKKGIKVFPDVNTSWHFDDKIGQKYLLEAIGAPLVKSYVFYSKQDAFDWINKTSFPKVFKLRGGAGSINVSLVKTKEKARQLARKSFRNGFPSINQISGLKDRFWRLQRDKNLAAVKSVFKGFGRLFVPSEIERFSHNQKGYIYFQDFIPNNEYDTRLVVIGDKCFGGIRYCRKGDFRASGSGLNKYEPELLDKNFIRIAFDITKKLKLQSVAFDFVWDNHTPKIVEMSYSFPGKSSESCQGYWEKDLKWHKENINPQYLIIKNFIKSMTTSDISTCLG